jgi:hypothetical protein
MSYTEWLKAMGCIPKDTEFCLMDASERVTAGAVTVEFILTEAEGYERAGRRSGRDVFRTRLFLANPQNPDHLRIEVNENYLNTLDKSTVSSWGFSLHVMFSENRTLFEGACQSLKQKAALVGEQSKALLEATLSEEITRRITERLQSGDASGDLRQILDEHIQKKIRHTLIAKVAGASRGDNLTRLGIRQDANFAWEYNPDSGRCFDMEIMWQSLRYRYLGHNETIFPVNNNADAFCVRDAFLFSVNLQILAEQVARTIETVSGLAP